MHLREAAQLSTGPGGEVHLRFPDSSAMVLKETTEILVGTLLRLGNAFKAQITLKIGEVPSQVNPEKVVTSDFSISMPVATASVRGTIFTVRYVELPIPKATVLVTEGEVEVDPVPPALPTVNVTGGNIARVTATAVTTAALPKTSISLTGGQVKVSWPVTNTNATLETTTALNSALPWASAGPPVVTGGVYSVTVPRTAPARFFRLHFLLND